MNRCPHCFTATSQSTVTFMCVGGCEVRPDPHVSRILGVGVQSRPVVPVRLSPGPPNQPRPTSVLCPHCDTRTGSLVCEHCHQGLRPGWHAMGTTCVVMAGARSSGKSVFIAVALQQLAVMLERSGRTCSPFDQETARVFQDTYVGPLEDLRALGATRAALPQAGSMLPPPLVFAIDDGLRRHALVIRDVAGENLENVQTLDPEVFGFFRRADALLFMIDPLQVPRIRQMLAGSIPEPRMLGDDPVRVLTNLTTVLRQGATESQFPVPTGLVLSKFDALQALAEVDAPDWRPIMSNVGAAVQRDPRADRVSFDTVDAELLELEVLSLLEHLGATGFLAQVRSNFRESRWFAVSALGNQPSGDILHASGIAPFRVLDPLTWALARTGAVPTSGPQ